MDPNTQGEASSQPGRPGQQFEPRPKLKAKRSQIFRNKYFVSTSAPSTSASLETADSTNQEATQSVVNGESTHGGGSFVKHKGQAFAPLSSTIPPTNGHVEQPVDAITGSPETQSQKPDSQPAELLDSSHELNDGVGESTNTCPRDDITRSPGHLRSTPGVRLEVEVIDLTSEPARSSRPSPQPRLGSPLHAAETALSHGKRKFNSISRDGLTLFGHSPITIPSSPEASPPRQSPSLVTQPPKDRVQNATGRSSPNFDFLLPSQTWKDDEPILSSSPSASLDLNTLLPPEMSQTDKELNVPRENPVPQHVFPADSVADHGDQITAAEANQESNLLSATQPSNIDGKQGSCASAYPSLDMVSSGPQVPSHVGDQHTLNADHLRSLLSRASNNGEQKTSAGTSHTASGHSLSIVNKPMPRTLRSKPRRKFRADAFDSDIFDAQIYQQPGSRPPPGVCVPRAAATSSEDRRMYLHTNPAVHRMHNRSEQWHENKALEIKARGGRKAWFGKVAKRERWLRVQEAETKEPQPWRHRRPVDFGQVAEEDLPEDVLRDPAWVKACAWHRQTEELEIARQRTLRLSEKQTRQYFEGIMKGFPK